MKDKWVRDFPKMEPCKWGQRFTHRFGLLVFLFFISFPAIASAEKTHTLPSGDVELVQLTKRISEITGFSFLYGKELSGTVHLVIQHPVTPQEAFEIFLSVLSDKGYTTIEKGRVVKIVPKGTEIDPNLLFMKGEPIGPSDRRITVFIDLTHIASFEAVEAVRPLVSKEGKVLASPAGNRLIVVDDAANVDRIRKAVAAMDQEGARLKVEVVHLERANAVEIAEILKRLFPAVGRTKGSSFGAKFSAVADTRTNSIVLQAPDDEVRQARKLIGRIDDPRHPNSVTVEYLRNAGSSEIADLFKSLE